MNIKILKLNMNNFKGIKEQTIEFGDITNIYGENATGKTTVFDAFTWLLFDKDSSNKKDFNIKTLDKEGQSFHGLEHSVEGTLQIDERILDLKKVLTERWIKQRGAADKIFSGHETTYWVNEVPVKKSEYQEVINSLVDENIFKLITNPLFFNQNLSWQDRRKTLLEIVGDISNEDVINSNEGLERLLVLLEDRSLDQFKAMISSKKKKLNDEIKTIPIRIDELSRSIPILDEKIDYDSIEIEKKTLQKDIEEIEKDLVDQRKIAIDMMESFKHKQAVISLKKSELNHVKDEIIRNSCEEINDLKYKESALESKVSRLQREVKDLELSISQDSEQIERINATLTILRSEYSEISKEVFNASDESNFICPTCNQALPSENIEKQIDVMKNNFNNDKNLRLNIINKEGRNGSKRIEELKTAIEKNKEKIESYIKEIEDSSIEISELKQQIKTNEEYLAQINYKENEQYKSIEDEIAILEGELQGLDAGGVTTNDSAKILEKKKTYISKLDEINKILNSKQVIADAHKRITDLEDQQLDLANKILDLEGQEYLAEQFIRAKVDMLEEKINEKFNYVSFKMFNEQINGALTECCDTLIKGVPFQDGNNASKINAGMDIINSLTDHYSITAPIFVDNREAVNKLIETNSQVINLIVSTDKVLRIENNIER